MPPPKICPLPEGYTNGTDKMKILKALPFSPDEIKLLKRVFLISLALCIVSVAAAWFIHDAAIKRAVKRTHERDASTELNLSSLYAGKVRDLLPIDIDAHRAAAEQLEESGSPGKTIKHLLRILSVERRNRVVKLKLATTLLKANRFGEAERSLKSLLDEEVEDSLTDKIAARYGLTLFYSGKIEDAIGALDRCIDNHPGCAEALCYRGQVEAATNLSSANTETYLRKALEIRPSYPEALYQLARYYMNKPGADRADVVKALPLLANLLELKPLDPRAHSRLGMAYYYLGKYEFAEKSYQTALSLHPQDFNTRYNLGELYYCIHEDSKRALQEYRKALQVKPDHVEANFRVGLICLGNSMLKEAVKHFEKARAVAPHNVRNLLQLAVAYEKLSMPSQAKAVYEEICDLDDLNDIARQKLRLLAKG